MKSLSSALWFVPVCLMFLTACGKKAIDDHVISGAFVSQYSSAPEDVDFQVRQVDHLLYDLFIIKNNRKVSVSATARSRNEITFNVNASETNAWDTKMNQQYHYSRISDALDFLNGANSLLANK
jgi:hypothetical protein